jgi:hypothetical protein
VLGYSVRSKILTFLLLLGWYLLGLVAMPLEANAGAQAAIERDSPMLLPTEPDEFDRREVDSFYDWRNNLFFRVFTIAGRNGQVNFMTARRTYKVSMSREGYEVAITFAHPLFYWLDRNANGEFEPDQGEMWIDIEEDGINGNEKPYDPQVLGDSPRGPVPLPPIPSLRPRALSHGAAR